MLGEKFSGSKKSPKDKIHPMKLLFKVSGPNRSKADLSLFTLSQKDRFSYVFTSFFRAPGKK